MRTITLPLTLLATAIVALLYADPARAQLRVFVGGHGLDSNPCTFISPCRTFQHAHDTVAAGGEIDVLDPAGYGPVNIIKAISIQGHGFAGVSVAFAGTGITIGAPSTAIVNLNGLLVEGNGVGNIGIQFNSGKALIVANCVVRNTAANGIYFVSTAATLQTLSVSNSSFSANGANGILVQTSSSGDITAAIDGSVFYANGTGFVLYGAVGTGALKAEVRDSTAGNNDFGFNAQSAPGQSVTELMLTRTTAIGNNNTGVVAFGTNGLVRLAQSTITANTNGYAIVAGGAMLTYGDNYIDSNGSNSGSLGPIIKQ
jgi:hypothetical protein